jgi:hypothetical protein
MVVRRGFQRNIDKEISTHSGDVLLTCCDFISRDATMFRRLVVVLYHVTRV